MGTRLDQVRLFLHVCMQNGTCGEVVASAGTGRVDINQYEDENHGWVEDAEDLFTPKFFQPPLRLIDIPLDCPFDVVAHLHESFSLFFADPGAALNCARIAVEVVLNELGVKRFITVNGVRRPINLHQRIAALPKKYEHLIALLTAIKWLGNAGSHSGATVTLDDVLLAYDLVEHVLREIYDNNAKKLTSKAKKINKKKGPIK